MTAALLLGGTATLAPLAPLVSAAVLAIRIAAFPRPSNRSVLATTAFALTLSFLASIATLAGMLALDRQSLVVDLGRWFEVGPYHFEMVLQLDDLSLPLAVLCAAMCALIGRFSMRYLHGEPGHHRFFLLLLVFSGGMLLLVEAGTIDVLFAGWELVGISSALLVSFFHERTAPVHASLRTFATYRLCDMGLLTAAVLLHAWTHQARFQALFGSAGWSHGTSPLHGIPATIAALCLVLAALGKSAQVPLSGWLPRAMEGPTPSSALVYGALSIHAGAYLLLRHAPLLDAAPAAGWLLVAIGTLTALHATLVGRVQTEVKTSLAYASMCQSGLILAEIGLGFRYLALAHVLGHALLRSLQFLQAPSFLQQFQHVAAASRDGSGEGGFHAEQLLPDSVQARLLGVAVVRGFHDEWLDRLLVRPLTGLSAQLDRWERSILSRMGGEGPG